MSYRTGPKIVTDGLVLCLDAGDRNSYAGSGSTWYDLSGNGNNGTLINGVDYSNANKGSLVLDGASDYISLASFDDDSNNELSVFFWVNLSQENYYLAEDLYMNWIVNKRDNGSDRQWQLLTVRDPNNLNIIIPNATIFDGPNTIGSTAYNGSPSYQMNLGTWHYVGFTTSGINNGFLRTYLDGNLNTYTTLTGNRKKGSRPLIIGTTAWSLGAGILEWIGKIANGKIYNRALSNDEITQNYNATKGRFGL